MNFNMEIRLSSKKHKCLCFTHAVQEAMKNVEIFIEVDSFNCEYDMRQTWCSLCDEFDYPFKENEE